MNFLAIKINSLGHSVAALQVFFLFSYFFLNIVNVGEMGTALPLLAGFVFLACADLLLQSWRGYLAIKLHFFIFLLFVAWLSFRVLIDLQDVEHLKQLTVATTGGVLLFFLLGTFVRKALNNISMTDQLGLAKCLLFVYALFSVFAFISFQDKLSDRSDIFYIEIVDGKYQRPGNFLIMLFIMVSFLYLSIAAHFQTQKFVRLLFWLTIYSTGMFFSLISSQMIGSNAATANILAIFSMTVVLSLLAFNKSIRRDFLNNHLALPLSKSSFKKIIKYSVFFALIGVVAAVAVIQITGFDLSKTRAFGFGANENSSFNSRLEILKETGINQMSYSPVFGNVDVARLTTGEVGATLHNFLPNVIAEIGMVGLGIIIFLFVLVANNLLGEIKQNEKNNINFMRTLLSFWLLFMFIFLFLYINFAVGKEWPVMWFFVGFSTTIFSIKYNSRERKTCAAS